MLRRDGLSDGGLIERDPIKVSAVPPCKGPFVIGTVATHIAKGGVSREHEHTPQDMGGLTAWVLDCCQISWRLCGGKRRSTAPGMLAHSLPDHMASRPDILSEGKQKGARQHERRACAMSRHVMWHEQRAV